MAKCKVLSKFNGNLKSLSENMIVKTLINHESYIALLCSINWIGMIENEIKFQELKLNKRKHLLYRFDNCKPVN